MKKAGGGEMQSEMKTYGNYAIVIVAFLCVFGSVETASAFRCGTQLVGEGDTRAEVIQKCGEPTFVDSWEEELVQRDFGAVPDYDPRTGRYEGSRQPFLVKIQVKIELWTYNLGPTQFTRYLRFENGILREITTGAKGY
jgi:hypothetical protein